MDEEKPPQPEAEKPKEPEAEKPVEEVPFKIPEQIGQYKIDSLYTVGGMSYILLSKHPVSGETVAIKIVREKYLKDREMLTRLLNEGKVLGVTAHPGIVKLFDLGLYEHGIYVAMEFVKGISLRSFIKKNQISHRRAMEIILDVCAAMSHLHGHSVIHRDLKPDNILMTEEGKIKLVDFGIAQFINIPEEERITIWKSFMGTPSYMAPEQKENPSLISYYTDIYALGIIAYELYLGKFCHGLIRIDLLPRTFRKIIEKALQPDPAERYQELGSFIHDIQEFLQVIDEKKIVNEEIPEDLIRFGMAAHAILFPKKMPKWPGVEVAVVIKEGTVATPHYLDFFNFGNERSAIVLAEAVERTPEAMIHAAVLRGIVHAAAARAKTPLDFLAEINDALAFDPLRQQFRFSLLWLDPKKSAFSFASCGFGGLWRFSGKGGEPHLMEPNNPFLGFEAEAVFSLFEGAWESGDVLVFTSLEEPKKPAISGDLPAPSQAIAEKVLAQTFPEDAITHRASVVSVITRT